MELFPLVVLPPVSGGGGDGIGTYTLSGYRGINIPRYYPHGVINILLSLQVSHTRLKVHTVQMTGKVDRWENLFVCWHSHILVTQHW